jgi:hypothetical protein
LTVELAVVAAVVVPLELFDSLDPQPATISPVAQTIATGPIN